MPFLTDDIVSTDRSHVRPLYQHLLHPDFGASLSFIGLPFKVVPFPQFEVQARLVARLLSGKAALPSQSEMEEWMGSLYGYAAPASALHSCAAHLCALGRLASFLGLPCRYFSQIFNIVLCGQAR